jgi:hypothetical protein
LNFQRANYFFTHVEIIFLFLHEADKEIS